MTSSCVARCTTPIHENQPVGRRLGLLLEEAEEEEEGGGTLPPPPRAGLGCGDGDGEVPLPRGSRIYLLGA